MNMNTMINTNAREDNNDLNMFVNIVTNNTNVFHNNNNCPKDKVNYKHNNRVTGKEQGTSVCVSLCVGVCVCVAVCWCVCGGVCVLSQTESADSGSSFWGQNNCKVCSTNVCVCVCMH